MLFYVLIGVSAAVSAVLLTMMSCKIMQMLQLSSYRAKGLFAWLKATKFQYWVRYFACAFFATICMLVFVGCFGKIEYVKYIGLAFYFLNAALFVIVTARQKSKTPLKCTARIIRLSVLSCLLFGAASFGLLFVSKYIIIQYSLLGLLPLFVPVIVLLAHYVLLPFETLNNMRYISAARRKLDKASNLIKIGITGSYGKTTAKNILAAMLSAKYNVLYSPSSFNTPLGIARTVNYELSPSHNVFIAEMGARRKGDIAELCALVKPRIGIITAVGNQHLETFGSVENVAAAKYELIEALGADGFAVFSEDNEYTREMYEKTDKRKAYGLEYGDVKFGACGSEFTLTHGEKSVTVRTKLLGKHIPSLAAVCAAAAVELGVPLEDISAAMEKLAPVPHRLELIERGDVTVIDDAYNSNTVGAVNALDVLKEFDGTRIVVTPGLVELGEEEERANETLGQQVASRADYAYFVGGRAQALKRGALDGGMAEDKIFVCADLDEAVAKLGGIAGKKTVLFENDLPDNY